MSVRGGPKAARAFLIAVATLVALGACSSAQPGPQADEAAFCSVTVPEADSRCIAGAGPGTQTVCLAGYGPAAIAAFDGRSCGSAAPSWTYNPSVGLANPQGIAVDEVHGEMFVANEYTATVTVYPLSASGGQIRSLQKSWLASSPENPIWRERPLPRELK